MAVTSPFVFNKAFAVALVPFISAGEPIVTFGATLYCLPEPVIVNALKDPVEMIAVAEAPTPKAFCGLIVITGGVVYPNPGLEISILSIDIPV